MFFVSEVETMTTTGVFQRMRSIDEKYGVIHVVFLAEFSNERACNYAVCRWLKPCMK